VPADDPSARRLESWKEVAADLKRDVSTVRRWERREGLPIYRQVHASRDSIFAYPAEIDSWLQSRHRVTQHAAAATDDEKPDRQAWSRAAMGLAVALTLVLAVLAGLVLSSRPSRALPAAPGLSLDTPHQAAAYRFYLRGRQRMEARNPRAFTWRSPTSVKLSPGTLASQEPTPGSRTRTA
jgi:hypothetical protein